MPPEAVFYDLNRVFAPIPRFKKSVKYTGRFDINHKTVHFRALALHITGDIRLAAALRLLEGAAPSWVLMRRPAIA
jgi:hypothetical protein